jgi:hypothetical protein
MKENVRKMIMRKRRLDRRRNKLYHHTHTVWNIGQSKKMTDFNCKKTIKKRYWEAHHPHPLNQSPLLPLSSPSQSMHDLICAPE